MKTRPFRRATAEMLKAGAGAVVAAAFVALVIFPPWTWFGIGRPLIQVSLGPLEPPGQPADWANLGWAILVALVLVWAGRVASYWNEEDAKAEGLPEEQPR